ncbi:sphingomyelin phosphodiesterase [Auriscalpium vulgare]|uniref:Sphingomyelin phosphodiesterase n=1 Tax=Auriscalpium vulgare TaxID=40419 RepID=A0ACB8SC54_9AGAM|nr:sphingomyelin phosphodiesterase [Auriscalpium vulgare]
MTRYVRLLVIAGACVYASAQSAQLPLGPSTFTAPGTFPTSLYKAYYNNPTATSAQPQPVILDPVSHKIYPFSLTNPERIPQSNTQDPHILPPPASDALLLQNAISQITALAANPVFANSTCALCQATLEVAKFLALAAPTQGPAFAVALCTQFKLSSTCAATYGPTALGAVLTQVFANADVGGYDGQMICQNFLGGACAMPPTSQLDLTGWFAKPKPNPLPPPKKPSGERLKVLHLSDFHIDPRYATGAEANCTSGLCCRANNFNTLSPNTTLSAAPRFGAFKCDTPLSLAAAALEAIPVLAGTEKTGFALTVYTGDLVAHDSEPQLSRDYILYTETLVYDLFKRTLGSGPVYAALGNHDSYNQAQDATHSLGGQLAQQFSWNYDHVAALWQYEDWIPESAANLARAHYAGYAVERKDGLRIITLNTDFANWFNYVNLSHPDTSGMLRFLTDELQAAEDAGDRAWIVGHVLSGWDGTNGLENPTDLFYQIVDRFSPHVIANIFFGHTHEDQLSIFYANNGTSIAADTALATAWMGPSITPLTNLNSGFRVYEVDSATFDIVDAHTWRSDVSSYPALDAQTQFGPTYVYEYSTRAAYGADIPWGANDSLNATWWHHVTEQMEANSALVTTFHGFQGKQSVRTQPCTGDCIEAKICYMRSGSSTLSIQNCPRGFGSVQGG